MTMPKVNRVAWHRRSLVEGAKRRWQSIHRKTAKRVGILAGLVAGCGIVLHYLDRSVAAYEQEIAIPRFDWGFKKPFKSFDHATLRRGWTVYRTVCRTCHSLRYIRFMDLVETTHTREEAKAIAAEYEVQDGPDEMGNYYNRPAKLVDPIPSPYPNEEAARAANFGAYPPDLTQVVLSRKRGIDYCFSLLTGFMDPPAGIVPNEGQYFNVYFPGGFTTMPQLLYDGMVEYDDDTPASASQMSKDVVEFLTWTAMQEHDVRMEMMIKAIGIFLLMTVAGFHVYRRYWSTIRSQRIAYVPITKFATPDHRSTQGKTDPTR